MRYYLTIICLSLVVQLNAQHLKIQQGFSASIYFGNEFKYMFAYNPNISYPISTFSQQAVIPMLDFNISLYNNNLGASVLKSFRNLFHINVSLGPTISYSFIDASIEHPGYIPIFTSTFNNISNSDYDNNIGFSVIYNWQFNFGGGIKARSVNQRIGNLFVSTKYVFLQYYNDGGPVNKWFGDKEDRYWTGGGSIGTKFTSQHQLHYLKVTFDKYSGFNQNAFEATSLLYSDNVNYKDVTETSYNSGKYSIKYLNPNLHFGAAINFWNSTFDFQDFIHRDISSSPYHFKLTKPYIDFEILTIYEN